MIYIKSYILALKNYVTLDGRTRRKDYWMFVLMNFLISIVVAIVSLACGTTLLSRIYSLLLLIPSFTIAVRRLHDIGKSGAWFALCFLPIIGQIWFLVLMCTNGQPFANDYGEDPKSI